jgi:hypothetical protein
MSALLANLVFMNGWALAAMAALPLLWYLLRVTPPAPRRVQIPSARFLEGLIPENQTATHTPWWILFLRMLTAALVLAALAHPVYNPAELLPPAPSIRIVIDNSWAAARTWDDEMKAAEDILTRAGREKKEIYLLTTAPAPGKDESESFGPMSAAQALSVLKGLKPQPWSAANAQIAKKLQEEARQNNIYSFWLSHGLDEGGGKTLADILSRQGGLRVFAPSENYTPLLLSSVTKTGIKFDATLIAAHVLSPGAPLFLQAVSESGQILDRQAVKIGKDEQTATATFSIPGTLHNQVSQIRIEGQKGAGALYILDNRFERRLVGIAGTAEDNETKPFIEDIYYLKRALEPYADIESGNITDILKKKPAMIILPDIGAMPAETLGALEQWVRKGGLLLRFAGPNMTQAAGGSFLVPVPLRAGERTLEGTLSWKKPAKLAPFADTSPFYGITLHEDLAVRRQILADPTQDLEEKTWAALDDGTPLITADRLGDGLLVMVHTGATPEWSDLALSGVYVEILQRLAAMAGNFKDTDKNTGGVLQPLRVYDGFGASHAPESWVMPLQPGNTTTNSTHPPGLYGDSGVQTALNLGDHVARIKALDIPSDSYGGQRELDLRAPLLCAALLLLLADWLIMTVMAIGLQGFARLSCFALVFFSVSAQAQSIDDIKYADGLYLAYIRSGDAALDALSQKGLENLRDVLIRRTSAEPDGVVGLDPETDTLVFFPLLYWPISDNQKDLSATALQKIQHYIDHGGTILFDTRETGTALHSLNRGGNSETLRRLIGGLNIPPLEPIPKDHVLARSFYLIESFPGRYDTGALWVETNSTRGRDGVSSVIIGTNDWAGAWAADRGAHATLNGGTHSQELSYRFGINVVMYALTGNYKADQVHVPHILERLGQ